MTLVWEGLDLRPAHGRWKLWVEQGRDELPGVRSTSDLIPFRRGRLHKPGIADTRQLELRGYIREETLAGFRATNDTLKGLLDPERAEPGTLVDDQEDGSQRWIRAVPRPPLLSMYGGGGTRILSIELEALDPYWYGSYGFGTLDSGLFLDDGNFLDQGAEIVVVPTSTSHVVSLTVPGTADIERVRLRFTGPSTGGVGAEADGIGFAMTNKLTGPVGGGDPETLTVDNYGRTVIAGAGASKRNEMTLRTANRHGEYIRLRPGANELRILGMPAEARIHFTPTWQ